MAPLRLPMPSRLESLMVAALPALLALALGTAVLLPHDRVDWEAVANARHALNAAHPASAEPQEVKRPSYRQPDLGLIGFVSPPLPTLCLVPLALISPALTRGGLAALLVSALCFGWACGLINRLGAEHGLRRLVRWPLVALFALHPLPLTWAATGSALMLLLVLLIGALRSLVRWGETDSLRDLLAASLYLTAAIQTRYEAVWVLLAALALIALIVRSQPRPEPARLEGTLLAFLVPVLYAFGLWVLFNQLIVGDALHFWRQTFAGPAASLRESLPRGAAERAAEAFGLSLLLTAPALLPLLLGAVQAMDRGRPVPALAGVSVLTAAVLFAFGLPYVFLVAAAAAGEARVVPWVGGLGLALVFALAPGLLGAVGARPGPGTGLVAALTWAALIVPLTPVIPGAANFPGHLALLAVGDAALTGDRAPELDLANTLDGLPRHASVVVAGSKAYAVALWTERRIERAEAARAGRWQAEPSPRARQWYVAYDSREMRRKDLFLGAGRWKVAVVSDEGKAWVVLRVRR